MMHYDFDEQRRMSHGVAVNKSVQEILLQSIPGALDARSSNEQDDRNGTDWWVKCESGHELSVDVKARSEDWLAKNQEDDLALELWSDKERQVYGWTLRTDKRTDYVLWFWSDTGRYCLIPFPMLCSVFWKHGRIWSQLYKRAQQRTSRNGRQWVSECVFVPRKEVWVAIYKRYAKGYLGQ